MAKLHLHQGWRPLHVVGTADPDEPRAMRRLEVGHPPPRERAHDQQIFRPILQLPAHSSSKSIRRLPAT